APPSVVFSILADPRQHARIDGSGTVRDLVTGPSRLYLGARFGMDMKLGLGYRVTNTVVEFAENELIAWRHFGLHRWRYELSVCQSGTLVTETWDSSYYPSLLQAVLRIAGFQTRNQRGIEATLARLSQAAEHDNRAGES